MILKQRKQGPGLEHYGSLLRHGTLALGDRKRIHHVYLFERLLLILKSKTLSQTGPSSDGKKPKLFGKSPTPPLQTQLPQQQVTRFKVIHKIPLSMSVIKQVSTNDSINETFFRIAFCPLDTPTIRSTASDETTQVKVLDFYAINRAVRTQWTDALNKSIIYDRPKFTPTETYESLNRPKSKKRESSTGGGLRRVLSLFGSMSRLNLNEEKTSSGSLERSLVSSSNPVTTPEPPLPAMSVVELVSQEKEEAAPVLLNQVETEVTPLTEFPALNEEPRPSSSIESIQEPPAESIIPDKDLPALPELVDFDAYEALYRDYQAKIVEVEGLKVRLDTLFLTRHPLGLSSAPLKFDASIQTDLEVSTAETETETTTTESNVQAIFEALEQKEENVEVSSEKLKVSIKPPVTHKKDKKTVVPQAHKAKAGSKKQQSKPISIVTKTLSPSNIAQTGSTPSMSSSGFTSPPNSPSRPVSPTRTPPRNRKTTLDRPQTPSSVSRPTVSSTAKQTRRTSR